MYARLVCSCLWIQSVFTLVACNLHSKFKEFDELTPDNFTVMVKRDAMSGQVYMKIVTFFALRNYFVLHLVPGSPVLQKDFVAHTMDGDGRMTPVHVDQQIFYTGYLNGNPQQSVDAVHTDNVWIAQIHGSDDVYSIEPLTHHTPDSPATSMLIFRQRDINSSFFNGYSNENATLQPFCEEVQFTSYPLSDSLAVEQRRHIMKNISGKTNPYTKNVRNSDRNIGHRVVTSIYWGNFNSEAHVSRENQITVQYKEYQDRWRRSNTKRDTPRYDTCEMLVIADFETYKGMGRSNILRMISILVYLYQSVDRIYRETIFDSFTNLGIVIARLIVHTEYTDISNHYNMPNNAMSIVSTLFSLFSVKNLTNYCLVHLTTQRNFAGTMGIATTGSPNARHWGNGICAGTISDARNVGLSTPTFSENIVLPVVRYLLVLAHEIGHNWGSHHDPTDDPECNPSNANGGAYMMSTTAALAASANARTFSPCSRQQIAAVLNVKAHMCFKPRSHAEEVCGNNIVEPEEDCDAGYMKYDPCCTKRCRFQDNAVCSSFNHPCCTNSCQIAPPTQKCFADFQDCHEDAFCSGTESHTCPEPRPLPNSSPCQSLGRCWHGKCVSFCELLSFSYKPTRRLLDCTCDQDRTTMCQHCCWEPGGTQECTKMGGTKIDGAPCIMGICDQGVCVDRQMDDTFHDFERAVSSTGSKDAHQPGGIDDVLLTCTVVCLGWLMAVL